MPKSHSPKLTVYKEAEKRAWPRGGVSRTNFGSNFCVVIEVLEQRISFVLYNYLNKKVISEHPYIAICCTVSKF